MEEARQELYKLLGSGAPEEKVVEQSQKLDRYIVEYHKRESINQLLISLPEEISRGGTMTWL